MQCSHPVDANAVKHCLYGKSAIGNLLIESVQHYAAVLTTVVGQSDSYVRILGAVSVSNTLNEKFCSHSIQKCLEVGPRFFSCLGKVFVEII